MDQDEVEVHKNAKRERGQYPAILTELRSLVNNGFLFGIKNILELWKGSQFYANVMARFAFLVV